MDINDIDDMKPAVISTVIVTNILLNSLVIAVIARYPQLREDRSALFVFSLTVSDIAVGCTSMPISAAVCSRATPAVRNLTLYLPKIQHFCSVWFSFCSVHSLCWVTLCKMVAITKPFRYEQLLTTNRCYGIIVCIWLTGAVVATAGSHHVMKWNLSTCLYNVPAASSISLITIATFFLGIVGPFTAIAYATTRILCAIVRTHIQNTAQVMSIGGQNADAGTSSSLTLRAMRSGKNILLLCLALLILSVPLIIYVIAVMIGRERDLPSSFQFIATWTAMSNSAANSLFYLVLFKSVRKRMATMLSELWKLCG